MGRWLTAQKEGAAAYSIRWCRNRGKKLGELKREREKENYLESEFLGVMDVAPKTQRNEAIRRDGKKKSLIKRQLREKASSECTSRCKRQDQVS